MCILMEHRIWISIIIVYQDRCVYSFFGCEKDICRTKSEFFVGNYIDEWGGALPRQEERPSKARGKSIYFIFC